MNEIDEYVGKNHRVLYVSIDRHSDSYQPDTELKTGDAGWIFLDDTYEREG